MNDFYFVFGRFVFCICINRLYKISVRYLPFEPDELLNVHGHHAPFCMRNPCEMYIYTFSEWSNYNFSIFKISTLLSRLLMSLEALLPFRIH